MRLLLVRHGESVCGANGIVGGVRGCTGLTELGLAQARALRDRFAAEGFRADALLASTLPRAIQTAEVLAETLDLEISTHEDLCELVPGEIDGTRWDDFRLTVGDDFKMEDDPDRPLSPGGESLAAFQSRVRGLLDRLAATYEGKTVVAACHGGIVYNSIYVLTGRSDPETDWSHNTAVTEWSFDDGGWRLVRHNDFAHIDGTELLPAPTA